MSFGVVAEKADRVLIVATGPSVEKVPLNLFSEAAKAGVYILAVNTAILWLPAVHGWVTVDPSWRNQVIMHQKRRGVTYYCAIPKDFGRACARARAHRLAVIQPHVVYLKRIEGWSRLQSRFEFSLLPDR